MIPIINRLSEKYSFNREINDERIKREKLLLPATDKGEIDFAFMSAFMKDVEHNILNTTLKVFKERLSVNKLKMGGEIGRTSYYVIYSQHLLLVNQKDLIILKNQIVVLAILVRPIKIMGCYVL